MSELVLFATLGLASGVAFAGVGLGVVTIHKASGVVNLAQAAVGMWAAFTYHELHTSGALVWPVPGLPDLQLDEPLPVAPSIALALVMGALLGAMAYLLVFRPLHAAPTMAKVVASAGLLTVLQSLIVVRFGTTGRVVEPVVPRGAVDLLGTSVPGERLWSAAVALAVTGLLVAWFRFTPIGLATRAASENEFNVALAGWSPTLLGLVNWVVAAMATGALAIVAAYATGLNAAGFALLIVPGLAAALFGRLSSLAATCLGALGLGVVQSLATYYGSRPGWPRWTSTGLAQLIAFLLVALILFLGGSRLPFRGEPPAARLPAVRREPLRPGVVAGAAVVGLVALLLTDGSYRFGLITSLALAIISLSLVLLTGLVGQISFAHAAVAGVAGFTLAKLGDGVPFPATILVAATAATVAGVAVGLPALRIRGAQLAIISLAGAVTLEQFVFRNPAFTDQGGEPIPPPRVASVDLAVRRGDDIARLPFGLFALATLMAVAWAVANLTRSALGRRFLAVRADEAAAASAGIDVARTKVLAYAASSFVAGIGGAVLGYSRGQLSADSFVVFVGIGFVVAAYLGGITSVPGALVAGLIGPLGLVYVASDRLLSSGRWYALLSGTALLATLVVQPDGLAAVGDRLRRRSSPAADAEPRASTVAASPLVAPSVTGPALQVTDLTVSYGGVTAVDHVDLTVRPGELVGLIGPNGAGKTSIVDAITGFGRCTGTVRLGDVVIDRLAAHDRQRTGLARTWQSTRLIDELTALENLDVVAHCATWSDLPRAALRASAPPSELLDVLGTVGAAHLADRRAGELTPGERKLVDLGRALAGRPTILLADEPAAGLDSAESELLGAHLQRLTGRGLGVLLVEHDLALVRSICDRLVVVDFGRVIASGTTADVLGDPAVVSAYLGAAPVAATS